MLDSAQHWHLFGYDMRQLGRHWQLAWAEFLWGDRSPVRARLDEPVRAIGEAADETGESAERYFQAGREVHACATRCRAIVLPEELTLIRHLRLPLAAEDDLPSAMALEVMSCSPFPPGDTASGWSLVGRDDGHLHVALCIVSRSATMRYLGQRYDLHSPDATEIWALAESTPIVLRGFGERERLVRYKSRLLKFAGMALLAVGLLLGVLALSAAGKYLEMRQYQALSEQVQRDAREVAEARSTLARANETVLAVNEIAAEYPNPHVELVRLTRLLGDDAYIAQFSMRGRDIRLRGRGRQAASVMQELTDNPSFESVTAPQGITRVGNSGLEQFYINIRLPAQPASGQPASGQPASGEPASGEPASGEPAS